MSYKHYSRAFKRAVAIEYMQSGKSRMEISAKYNLPNVNTLSSWVNSCLSPLEIKEKCASLSQVNVQAYMETPGNKASTADNDSAVELLQEQIRKLEAELRKEKDRVLALNTLIDIAEEQGIRIRKKSGAKQ